MSKTFKISSLVQFNLGTFGLDWATKVIIMDNAHDLYEEEKYAMGENIHIENAET